MRVATLKRRAEFQRIRGGGRWSSAAFVLEGKQRLEAMSPGAGSDAAALVGPRFGFTVTKKLGGAVVRNRIRRRLRAAVGELATTCADPRCDYVIVARPPCLDIVYADLRSEMAAAFKRVNAGASKNRGARGNGKPA